MEIIKKIFSIFLSGKFAAAIGIISFSLGMYTTFFFEKSGDITASISPMYKIFDMHRDIGGLEITLNGESLKKSKKTVWISRVKLENTGNISIKKSDFDDQYPLTINLSGGSLVENLNITASSEYLMNSLNIHGYDTSIVFSPAIIEPKDFVVVNFLVLGKESEPPTLRLDGKIAGIKSFKTFEEDTSKNFYFVDEILKVNRWWTHLIRAAFYFIVINLILILIIIAASSLWENIEKHRNRNKKILDTKRRKTQISKIKKWDSSDLSMIIRIYLNGGEHDLNALCNALDAIAKIHQIKNALSEIVQQEKIEEFFNRMFLVLGGTRHGMNLVKAAKIQVYNEDINRILCLKEDIKRLLEELDTTNEG